MTAKHVQGTLKAIEAAFPSATHGSPALANTLAQVEKAKVALAQIGGLVPTGETPDDVRVLARSVLEYGALAAARAHDSILFDRYYALLRPLYFDVAPKAASDRFLPLVGLNLMSLLSQSRIAEFHTELELIDSSLFDTSPFINFPLRIEQHLMEGSYNRVLATTAKPPLPEYAFFVDTLVETVRTQVAVCSQQVYNQVTARDLAAMMRLKTAQEALDFVAAEEAKGKFPLKWVKTKSGADVVLTTGAEVGSTNIKGPSGAGLTPGQEVSEASIPAETMIDQALQYARELELIV